MKSSLEIVLIIFQGLICSAFFVSFLKFKNAVRKTVCALSTGVLSAGLVLILSGEWALGRIAPVLYIVLLPAYAFTALDGNIPKRVILSLAAMLPGLGINALNIILIAEKYRYEPVSAMMRFTCYVHTAVCVQMMSYVFCGLMLKTYRSKSRRDMAPTVLLLLLPVILSAVLQYAALDNEYSAVSLYISFSILSLAVVSILIWNVTESYSSKRALEKELELSRLREHYQGQYIESLRQQYDSIRKIKHDTKNRFLAIGKLLEYKEYDKAVQFVSENTQRLSEMRVFIDTDNPIVNAVINSKLSYASGLGIKTSCLSVSSISGIADSDLCSVLGNALDNATAACRELRDSEISVEIEREGESFYTFIVRNTVVGSVLESNPELRSSKADGEHGWGTRIIRETAEKYGGRCDFYEKDDRFCCRIDMIAKTLPSD